MSGGFTNSVLGGVGNLIRSWIQSVPFVSGSQGWRISKNGNAEFNSVSIRGGVVVTSASQLFVYSSNPPALGTLIFSISDMPGTDPYDNAYAAGIVNYSSGEQIGIVNGTFTISTSFGDILELQWNTINFVLSLNDAVPLEFIVSQLMANLGVDGFTINAGKVTAVKPGTGTTYANPALPETWHALTLLNSWVNTAGTAQYRLLPTGDVQVIGQINGGTVGSGTSIGTLPIGYRPAHTNEVACTVSGATPTNTPVLQTDSNGNITMHNVPVGTTNISFSMIINLTW